MDSPKREDFVNEDGWNKYQNKKRERDVSRERHEEIFKEDQEQMKIIEKKVLYFEYYKKLAKCFIKKTFINEEKAQILI